MMFKTSTAIRTKRASDRATAVRWRIVCLLMAFSFMFYFNRTAMPVAGTEAIIKQHGIDKVQMGFVYSGFLLSYTICMLPGGWLIDRYGAKFALVVMGFGSGLCCVLTGFVGCFAIPALVFPALLVIRTLMGLPGSPMYPGAARTVSAWMPQPSRTAGTSLVTAAALIGNASTFYIFGNMLERWGWPTSFVIAGLTTLALAAVWTLYATNGPAGHTGVNAAEFSLIASRAAPAPGIEASLSWRLLLRNRSLILLTLSYAAVGYFQYMFFHWLEYYFETVRELDRGVSRLYTTVPLLAMAGGMFVGGWTCDRICCRIGPHRGRLTLAASGLLGGAAFLFLGLLAEDPAWVVAWFSCGMASVGMCEGAFWVTAIELGGPKCGSSAAVLNTGGNAGGILSPVVTPWLSSSLGWSGALSVAGLMCLVGAVLWLWIRPDERVTAYPIRCLEQLNEGLEYRLPCSPDPELRFDRLFVGAGRPGR